MIFEFARLVTFQLLVIKLSPTNYILFRFDARWSRRYHSDTQ